MNRTLLTARWLEIARELLEQPTAPVREMLPQACIREFAQARPQLRLSEDGAGNLLLKYGGGAGVPARRSPPPLIFVAHLDHPGFWIEKVSNRNAELVFKGWVMAEHVRPGQRVRYFEMGNPRPVGAGTILRLTADSRGTLDGAVTRVVSGRAPDRGFAMWDFPGFKVARGRIWSRCCDDLLGAAAALCALDEIARRAPAGVAVWGLFTRAEEVGFWGALEAVRLKQIPRNACVLSLECSKALSNARQGDGVVVRVGDRTSIFDPQLSEALRQAAENVKKSVPDFKYQRKLMDGGSCEATVFCACGYRSSGLTVPLGNYHNQAENGLGPENVNVQDFVNEVLLLVELAQHPEWLEKRSAKPAWLAERAKAAREGLTCVAR